MLTDSPHRISVVAVLVAVVVSGLIAPLTVGTATADRGRATVGGGADAAMAALTADARFADHTEDVRVRDGGTFFIGQRLYTEAYDLDDDVTLRRGDGTFVSDVSVGEDGVLTLDTTGRTAGDYSLDSPDGPNIPFSLIEQTYDVSTDRSTVRRGANAVVEISIVSNRNGYDHEITSTTLSTTQLNETVFADVPDARKRVEHGALVLSGGTTSQTLSANFSGLASGTHSLTFDVADTTASDSVSVRVSPQPTSVEVSNQQAQNGQVVFVDSVRLANGGFVSITTVSGNHLGVSKYLAAGLHNEITVTLDDPVAGGSTKLVAVVHRDTDGDQLYDFESSGGQTDEPYSYDGERVDDEFTVTVPTPTATPRPSPTPTSTATSAPSQGSFTVTQTPLSSAVSRGGNLTVRVQFDTTDLDAPYLRLTLPTGWSVVSHQDDGARFSPNGTEWSLQGDTNYTITYTVAVPGSAAVGPQTLTVKGIGLDPATTKYVRATDSLEVTVVGSGEVCNRDVDVLVETYDANVDEIPGPVRGVVTDETVHAMVTGDANRDYTVVTGADRRVTSMSQGVPDSPSIEIETDCETLTTVVDADDEAAAFGDEYDNGEITIRGATPFDMLVVEAIKLAVEIGQWLGL